MAAADKPTSGGKNFVANKKEHRSRQPWYEPWYSKTEEVDMQDLKWLKDNFPLFGGGSEPMSKLLTKNLPKTRSRAFVSRLVKILNVIAESDDLQKANAAKRLLADPSPEASGDDLVLQEAIVKALETYGKHSSSRDTSKAVEQSVKRRIQTADEFAHNMYQLIQDLKKDEKMSTYRETVAVLNKKGIPTFRGGIWHLKTVQDLNQRWKQLGLMNAKPD